MRAKKQADQTNRKTIAIALVDDPFTCPIHHETVKRVARRGTSKNGMDEEFLGVYYGCPACYGPQHDDVDHRYYVDGKATVVADVGQDRREG